MFRELARINNKLPQEECIELLQHQLRGVLSVAGDEGYPYGMPMNHFYNEDDGCLYFHSGMAGHKVDAIRACDKASFCVYDEGYRKDGDWALTIRSVIVFGRIEIVEDYDTMLELSRKLSYKFTDDTDYIEKELVQSGPRTLMFRLRPEHICGKRVHEA